MFDIIERHQNKLLRSVKCTYKLKFQFILLENFSNYIINKQKILHKSYWKDK